MSLFKIFDVAGSAMSAQTVRLNVVASNLANADNVSGTEQGAYKAKHPVFKTLLDSAHNGDKSSAGVAVSGIVESTEPAQKRYMPQHPLADTEGYVYLPNINPIEEMVNMISASRSYQSNVEVMNTSKELLLRTLGLGQ
ncbi:MAG: flagellar basal body rod protein FlgC [Pseudomonadota bacterium]